MNVQKSRSMPEAGSASSQRDSDPEASLLNALRHGEEKAFEAMVRSFGPRLLSVARRFLRDEEDARDAVQEGFLSAYRSMGSFQRGSQISTWLHRIVVNACLMRLRSRQRRPEESIEELLPRFAEDGHQVAHPTPEWEGSAEELLARRETRERVREAIDRLPESYRTVLLLRDIEELSTEEAARLVGITENAVKIRLHRARQALRTLLEPQFRRAAAW
jgi:RNA polymerase sigma-70 factor, ECF subfamily